MRARVNRFGNLLQKPKRNNLLVKPKKNTLNATPRNNYLFHAEKKAKPTGGSSTGRAAKKTVIKPKRNNKITDSIRNKLAGKEGVLSKPGARVKRLGQKASRRNRLKSKTKRHNL